jgi:hypothetical protein
MLSVSYKPIILSVIMLNVVMLRVVAPVKQVGPETPQMWLQSNKEMVWLILIHAGKQSS